MEAKSKKVFRCRLTAKTPSRDVAVNYDHKAPGDEPLRVTTRVIVQYLFEENSQALAGASEVSLKLKLLPEEEV